MKQILGISAIKQSNADLVSVEKLRHFHETCLKMNSLFTCQMQILQDNCLRVHFGKKVTRHVNKMPSLHVLPIHI